MSKLLAGLILTFSFMAQAMAADKVVLQLKWEHEFQFAGYYAALWQGYYKEAGIDVTLQSLSHADGSLRTSIDELESGRAQFAVGGLDILLSEDKGSQLTVLAPFFQQSASAIFTLQSTPLDDISQLAKLRIAAFDQESPRIELDSLFKSRGYDINDVQFVDVPPTVQSLIDGRADAILTYEVSALYAAKEKGIQLNKLDFDDFGVNFYGDTLYTTYEFAQKNPEMVQRFVDASIRGWRYALQHKEELVQRISNEFPRYLVTYDDFNAYNETFAENIESFLQYPQKPLANNNHERWVSMNERLRALGLIHSSLDKETFFFAPPQKDSRLKSFSLVLLALTILIPLLFFAWYRRKLSLEVVTVILIVWLLEFQVEQILKNQQKQNQELGVLRQLNSASAKLEGNLHSNLTLITGFAAYISAHPTLSEKEFSNYAREIFRQERLLINFAAAKDLIVNYVYPYNNNSKAIGLDYRKNDAQRDLALQVTKTGQLLVAGPINLVQGGVAFIGRAPIYTGDGANRRLWGIISAPLDAHLLYRYSDIESLSKTVNLAIKSYDSLGQEQPVFFGNKSVFDDPEAIITTISVGGGTWHIAATPINRVPNLSSDILILRIGSLISLFILCALVVFRFRQVEEKQSLMSTILSNQKLLERVGSVAKIGGWKIDNQFNFIQWSPQASLLLGKSPDFRPTTLSDISELFSEADFSLIKSNIELSFQEMRSFELELQLRANKTDNVWLRIIASSSLDDVYFITGTMQDITERVRSAQYIKHQATYDSLTDLPNRFLFNDRLCQAIETAKRNNKKIAVLFIDLDHFKPVNDNHGHEIGDQLLIEAAQRIKPCLRTSDTVARISGDEFGVLLLNVNHYEDAIAVTEHIIGNMQKTFELKDLNLYCSASIGIALYPNDGTEADELIRKADQAMYGVKKSGRNGWQFYTKEMQQESEFRHGLLNQLVEAIANNELMPYFQPIYDLRSNRLTKCETLARWQKSDGSFVPPDQFITLAEESGLVNKIDLNMLQNSSNELIKLIQDTKKSIGLAINVSPRLFHTKDRALDNWLQLIQRLSQQIDFTVEITERLITDDTKKALDILNQLKSYGVKIAIDDFGTGYSSLSYLVRFPVDIIKIDRSFIEAIGIEASAESLIETILMMAKKLNIQVVAEGIETQEQLDFLKCYECDYGQGYFLAKPMSAAQFKTFIEQDTYA